MLVLCMELWLVISLADILACIKYLLMVKRARLTGANDIFFLLGLNMYGVGSRQQE